MLTQRKRKLEEEIENYEDIGQKIIRKEQDKYSKSLNQIEELQQEKNKLVESFFKLSQERQELYKIIDYLQQLIRSQKDLIDKFEVAYKAVISQQFSLSEKYARLMKASDILLNRNIQIKPTTLKGVKEDTFSSTDSSDIWRDIRENG
jgi:predicted nuclease with TOPRIM domain